MNKCPYPFPEDNGTAKQCIDRGHCGCDEKGKSLFNQYTAIIDGYPVWVDINNCLPNNDTWVIAAMTNDNGVIVRPCKHDKGGVFRVGNFYPLVTHWMPLPKPPMI